MIKYNIMQDEDYDYDDHYKDDNCNYVGNRKWIRKDVEELYDMSINYCSISMMCRKLKRSRRSILHALRRIQTQQALFHSIYDVAILYNTDVEVFSKRLKDPLFYIEPSSNKNDIPIIIVVSTIIFGVVSLYGRLYCNDLL